MSAKIKTLYVVRHAKSSWDYINMDDIDRPLKPKGILRAYKTAHKLKQNHQIPQMIISSPANRALHTAVIFARALDFPLDQLFIDQLLYDSSITQIHDVIKKVNRDIESLMIVGHNPCFTHVVNHLGKSSIDNLPTSGVISLTFNSEDWDHITAKTLTNQVNIFENL